MRELQTPHTGLLRLGLAVSQSLLFWERAHEDWSTEELKNRAFKESWFGELSQSRAHYLVTTLERRFPFPARQQLGFKRRDTLQQNQLVCHWHLQLTDPLYRSFTTSFLFEQWALGEGSVNLEQCVAWVSRQTLAHSWKEITRRRLASALLGAAKDAGLCSGAHRGERMLRIPSVIQTDLSYLKGLLLSADAEAKLPDYLLSVGYSRED